MLSIWQRGQSQLSQLQKWESWESASGAMAMAFRPKTADHAEHSTTAEWLCELHQANFDSARVFQEAARVVRDESVSTICDEISCRRESYAEELEEYLTAHESQDHTSLTTVVHRAWLDLRASFSSANPRAVLSEALRGERRLCEGYSRAIAALAGSPVLGMIRRHLAEITHDVQQLRELHTAFMEEASDEDDSEDEES